MKNQAPDLNLYYPHLEGRELFEAALRVGRVQGESAYAQAMYLKDIEDQRLYLMFGYTCLEAFSQTLWDWSKRKTHEMLEVAQGIGQLPQLCEAFRAGRLHWTKARLLVRALAGIQDQNEKERANQYYSQKTVLTYCQLEAQISQEASRFGISKKAVEPEVTYYASAKWLPGALSQGLPGGKVQITFELPPDVYLLWERAVCQTRKELCEKPQDLWGGA